MITAKQNWWCRGRPQLIEEALAVKNIFMAEALRKKFMVLRGNGPKAWLRFMDDVRAEIKRRHEANHLAEQELREAKRLGMLRLASIAADFEINEKVSEVTVRDLSNKIINEKEL